MPPGSIRRPSRGPRTPRAPVATGPMPREATVVEAAAAPRGARAQGPAPETRRCRDAASLEPTPREATVEATAAAAQPAPRVAHWPAPAGTGSRTCSVLWLRPSWRPRASRRLGPLGSRACRRTTRPTNNSAAKTRIRRAESAVDASGASSLKSTPTGHKVRVLRRGERNTSGGRERAPPRGPTRHGER